MPGVRELYPEPMRRYYCGIDASAGRADSYALAIATRLPDGTAQLCAVHEVRAPFDPSAVTARFAQEVLRWRCRSVVGDAYAGGWVEEAWRANGVSYRTATMNKSRYYSELVPILTTGRGRLLDDDRLLGQFSSLVRRSTRTGEVVDHPPGPSFHDDVCNAAAIAMVEAAGRGTMHIVDRFRALT
jgi:hypothetical protein